ncbi:MAG: hypothetical protein WBJ68_02370, partial [Candidatus Dechloromonas phosphoritropha]
AMAAVSGRIQYPMKLSGLRLIYQWALIFSGLIRLGNAANCRVTNCLVQRGDSHRTSGCGNLSQSQRAFFSRIRLLDNPD